MNNIECLGVTQDFCRLQSHIKGIQTEIAENPEFAQKGVEQMREGIGVYLSCHAEPRGYSWMSPTMRFNPQNVSFERVEGSKVTPLECTPGGVEVWKNKVDFVIALLAQF